MTADRVSCNGLLDGAECVSVLIVERIACCFGSAIQEEVWIDVRDFEEEKHDPVDIFEV